MIGQPSYPVSTSDLVEHVGAYADVGDAALDERLETLESAASGSARTITVVVPGVMGGEGLNVYPDGAGVFDAVNRGIVVVPEKTSRWRLRVANRSAVREGQSPGSGTFNFTGCWMGTPLVDQERWQGLFASAPVQVIASGSTSGETEWVTPWVTDAARQLGPWPTALSLGMTAPTATNRFYDDRSCSFIGTGAAAAAGATGVPAGSTRYAFSSLDCRVEYEVTTAWPLVLALGDSITSGVSVTPSIFQYESWPARAAVDGRFHVINAGVSSMLSDYFNTTTHWGWGRVNLGSQVPDSAVVSLGANDLILGSAASAISTRLAALTTVLRTIGINRWSFGTVIPGAFTGGVETARQAHNANVRNGWWGAAGMVDFDRIMRASYNSASSTADLMDPANVHPKSAGYAAMATCC